MSLDLLKKIGINLKTIRESRGLTQNDLGELCELHRNYIGSLEKGQRNLSIKTLEKIANKLEINPTDLLI
jgi:transcriptional regulator with XRE-family HTH domain